MKGDFSRQTFKREKHYNSVRMQQGRVQVDADWNEQQSITLNRLETEAYDVIGHSGVPSSTANGFKIEALPDCNDLKITPGRIYVDGILSELEPTGFERIIKGFPADNQVEVAIWVFNHREFRVGQWIEINLGRRYPQLLKIIDINEDQQILTFDNDIDLVQRRSRITEMRRIITYKFQPDYPDPLDVDENGKYLVYLDVWYRHITALDDPQIREVALGGPDTATRLKTIWQVKLLKVDDNAECSQFGPAWRPPDAVTTGKMAAGTADVPPNSDPCILPPTAGYRGLENQLYRIEIHKGGNTAQNEAPTFKWSRNNGSVVASIKSINGTEIVVDENIGQGIFDLVNGQWVEILDDKNILNRIPGEMIQIETVDKAGKKIFLKTPPTPLSNNPTGVNRMLHPKLRPWDSGQIPMEAGSNTWTELDCGIEIRFDPGIFKTGDYWQFPARAATGQIEWPVNDIMEPVALPPHGVEHHYCPLALVILNDGVFQKIPISDCRKEFLPLTEIHAHPKTTGTPCYNCTVGDGIHNWGDFNDIQEAINNFHNTQEQVNILILPGLHKANVVIEGRKNITVKGCEKRTLIMPASDEMPIFLVRDSKHITLAYMDLTSLGGTAIYLDGTESGALQEIEVKHNRIHAYKNAVRVQDGEFIKIYENKIRMLDKEDGEAAIYVEAKDSLIEKNSVSVVPAGNISPVDIFPELSEDIEVPDANRLNPANPCADLGTIYAYIPYFTVYAKEIWAYKITSMAQEGTFSAPGGIQIANTSERIRIIENDIFGGTGSGITLGNIPPEVNIQGGPQGVIALFDLPEESLIALRSRFDGFLYDLNIEKNHIRNMGLNGIGVVGFLSLDKIGEIISVEDLTIYRNHIENCLKQIPPEIPSAMGMDMGFGGIALACCEDAVIRENIIKDNGLSGLEPFSGIFILYGERIDISDNRILNNGPRLSSSQSAFFSRPGLKGGIVIASSSKVVPLKPPEAQEGSPPNSSEFLYNDGIPSVKVHDNIVVQPLGQSLYVGAMGPVSIVGNHFTSQGIDAGNQLSKIAGAVFIVNLGITIESPSLYTGLFSPVAAPNYLNLPGGYVLFSNNLITWDLRASNPILGFAGPISFSSQYIASFDDVSYESNQSKCSSLLNHVFSDLILLAVTARMNNNRFQESQVIDFSLISYAIANMCTHNQASHNLIAQGADNFTISAPNTEFYPKPSLPIPFIEALKSLFHQFINAFLLGFGSAG